MRRRPEKTVVLVLVFVFAAVWAGAQDPATPAPKDRGAAKASKETEEARPAAVESGDDNPGPESKWERKPFPRTDAQWRKVLTRMQYKVLRRRQTEKAFSNRYWRTKTPGVYRCAGCGQPLFSSATKFDSGTGWPSFWAPYNKECVETEVETKFFIRRIEVHCSRCKGHLGHVFSDGPRPTGLRYCMNSAALILDTQTPPVPEESAAKK